MATFFSAVFDQILFVLTGNDGIYKNLAEFEVQPDLTRTTELAALECLKIDVATFFRLLFIRSVLNL